MNVSSYSMHPSVVYVSGTMPTHNKAYVGIVDLFVSSLQIVKQLINMCG